jgi:hypothetical protein
MERRTNGKIKIAAAMIALAGWFMAHGICQAAQPAKVRISYSSRSNSITPFQIALNKGFFAEEGWDVEMIQVNPRFGAISLSRNGEITDHEWDMLTEKRKPVDEVRDFTLLRDVQKELKLR